MGIMPCPAPPRVRLLSAAEEVQERSGFTIVLDRRPNMCRWVVHTVSETGAPLMIHGPGPGDPGNPSNTDLAAQLERAVRSLGIPVKRVYVGDFVLARMLEKKTKLPVTALAPPPRALEEARGRLLSTEASLLEGLTLACDSSRGRGTGVNGCGWVLSYRDDCADPILGSAAMKNNRGGIRLGELTAIRMGLKYTFAQHPSLQKGIGDVSVLTDSKPALHLLERVRTNTLSPTDESTAVREATLILEAVEGAHVSFTWVRGHAGHPLNELADRLAVMARRNSEMNIDELTAARMVKDLRKDSHGGVTLATNDAVAV